MPDIEAQDEAHVVRSGHHPAGIGVQEQVTLVTRVCVEHLEECCDGRYDLHIVLIHMEKGVRRVGTLKVARPVEAIDHEMQAHEAPEFCARNDRWYYGRS